MRSGVKFPVVAALACLAGLVLLLAMAYVVGPFARADANALNGLVSLDSAGLHPTLQLIAHTGDPLPLAGMLVALAGAGLALGRRRQALTVVAAVVGANVATQILKVVLAHPRVYPILGPDQIEASAFPSGHATAAMSITLAAVVICPPRLRSRVAPLAGLYALAVAVSILVLAWHFPSDVLGGFLVAAVFAFGAVAISRALAGREDPLPRPPRIAAPSPAVLLGGSLAAVVLTAGRYDELVQYARDHTSGAAVLISLASACAVLVAGASRLADR
jgi:membrane-associated phospholipid phosphatase